MRDFVYLLTAVCVRPADVPVVIAVLAVFCACCMIGRGDINNDSVTAIRANRLLFALLCCRGRFDYFAVLHIMRLDFAFKTAVGVFTAFEMSACPFYPTAESVLGTLGYRLLFNRSAVRAYHGLYSVAVTGRGYALFGVLFHPVRYRQSRIRLTAIRTFARVSAVRFNKIALENVVCHSKHFRL